MGSDGTDNMTRAISDWESCVERGPDMFIKNKHSLYYILMYQLNILNAQSQLNMFKY